MTVYDEDVKTQLVSLRVDEVQVKELQRRARQNERTLSAEVRVAIREYLQREQEEKAA